jgi:putative flippase GtrA
MLWSSEAMATRPSFLTSFKRSQVASFAATIADFGTLVCLVELAQVWYVAATAIGAFVGALTNFMFGRYWSFVAIQDGMHGQAFRYALVSAMSLVLNSGGVYLFTDFVGLKYIVSKTIVAILIGIFFNFPLHRHFVFRARLI